MTTRGRTVVLGLGAAAVLLTAPGAAIAQTNNVTFSRDVAPIVQRSCQGCHRAGQMGPMSLMTFEEVRPWARAIRSKVVGRVMARVEAQGREVFELGRGSPAGTRSEFG